MTVSNPIGFRSLPFVALALAALSPGCEGDAPGPLPGSTATATTDARWHSATTRAGTFVVEWRPVSGRIPLNESFELEVRARTAAGEALPEDAILQVQADMPEHGHGMLREPRSEVLGPGHWKVTGMLFHMTGHWVMTLDVIAGAQADSADVEVDVE